MLVEWRVPSEPNGKLDFYRVYFEETMTAGRLSRSENQVTVSGTNTFTMLKGLRPYTRYAIYVTAVNINSRNETLESVFSSSITTNRTFEDGMYHLQMVMSLKREYLQLRLLHEMHLWTWFMTKNRNSL